MKLVDTNNNIYETKMWFLVLVIGLIDLFTADYIWDELGKFFFYFFCPIIVIGSFTEGKREDVVIAEIILFLCIGYFSSKKQIKKKSSGK